MPQREIGQPESRVDGIQPCRSSGYVEARLRAQASLTPSTNEPGQIIVRGTVVLPEHVKTARLNTLVIAFDVDTREVPTGKGDLYSPTVDSILCVQSAAPKNNDAVWLIVGQVVECEAIHRR